MGNAIIRFLNYIISGLGSIVTALVSVLPDSPFTAISNSDVAPYLSGFAWVVPIPQILAILQAWITAVAIFYLGMIVLRWIKAIE